MDRKKVYDVRALTVTVDPIPQPGSVSINEYYSDDGDDSHKFLGCSWPALIRMCSNLRSGHRVARSERLFWICYTDTLAQGRNIGAFKWQCTSFLTCSSELSFWSALGRFLLYFLHVRNELCDRHLSSFPSLSQFSRRARGSLQCTCTCTYTPSECNHLYIKRRKVKEAKITLIFTLMIQRVCCELEVARVQARK